jgi:hypothetical protein
LAEWFARLDRNGDGRLTAADFDWSPRPPARVPPKVMPKGPPGGKGPPPGMPSRWVLLRGMFDGELGSMWKGPAVGEMAPDFKLPTQDGTRTISLRQFRGKKPVVLVFGSFT